MTESEGTRTHLPRIDISRHMGMVTEELLNRPIEIIGCGTLGSWVAHDLARLGFENLSLTDHDTVGMENCSAQIFRPAQCSITVPSSAGPQTIPAMHKTAALANILEEITNDHCNASEYPHKFCPEDAARFTPGTVVFSCVDSLEARKQVALAAQEADVAQFIDLRMGASLGSALFVPPMSWPAYLKTLEVEFLPTDDCGARAFLPTAHYIVGVTLAHWFAATRGALTLRQRMNFDASTGTTIGVREIARAESTQTSAPTPVRAETHDASRP